ncbi:hypothetical protein VE02_10113 [Pseudogymnoascus sp. 03VT05]|nr:hypothetical protein VE02_10113 [Pseudogymnoascus sp. 03VT05]
MFLCSTLLVAALSTLGESAASVLSHSKRWDTTLCTSDTSGVPIPDADNFQLPLENLRQDMCWDLCVGDQATCTTKTKICYDFHGPNLIFTYNAISGYTYTEAEIWLGLSAPASTTPTPQYTTSNGFCTISADKTTVSCNIPYDTIVPGGALLDVLAEMCPNGDREGYSLLQDGSPACTSYYPNTYWVLTYLCTKCPYTPPPPPPPPTVRYCPVGTAFGYSTSPLSPALNSLVPKPNTCNRWGWYVTPTAAQLSARISGPLYVGAGGNVISKATNVGTWSANSQGTDVFVTYALTGPYYPDQVHVDIGCMPFKKCAPGQYKYGNEALAGTGKSTFTTPAGALKVPTCSTGVYLIVHAAVDTVETIPTTSQSSTCHALLAN